MITITDSCDTAARGRFLRSRFARGWFKETTIRGQAILEMPLVDVVSVDPLPCRGARNPNIHPYPRFKRRPTPAFVVCANSICGGGLPMAAMASVFSTVASNLHAEDDPLRYVKDQPGHWSPCRGLTVDTQGKAISYMYINERAMSEAHCATSYEHFRSVEGVGSRAFAYFLISCAYRLFWVHNSPSSTQHFQIISSLINYNRSIWVSKLTVICVKWAGCALEIEVVRMWGARL